MFVLQFHYEISNQKHGSFFFFLANCFQLRAKTSSVENVCFLTVLLRAMLPIIGAMARILFKSSSFQRSEFKAFPLCQR